MTRQRKPNAKGSVKQSLDESAKQTAPPPDQDDTLSEARFALPFVDNTKFRLLANCPAIESSRQDPDYSIPVKRQWPSGSFPVGELLNYSGDNGSQRMSAEEFKERDKVKQADYDKLRKAAEVHRQTRRYMHSLIKPGMSTLELVQLLEAKSKELICGQSLEAGWAFPTGVSINHCAAHYTPNYGEDPVILQYDDVMKVDFGVHIDGLLIDSAWTVSFNEKYDPLVEATKEATNTGLKNAGIDMRLGELGGLIEEVIKSYEVEIETGKPPVSVKPIQNLSGHSIEAYRVHAGKSIPIVACDDRMKMEEGELYAIETFASTGIGKVHEEGPCSHYMIDYDWAHTEGRKATLRSQSALPLLKLIQRNHGTLAFCRRWLDDAGAKRHLLALKALEQSGIVNTYPPLCDVKGSFTSQMEHTILLRPTCKEILSRGDDY